MTTGTKVIERLEDDTELRAARQRHAETQRTLQEAQAVYDRLAPQAGQTVQDLDFFEAQRAVKRAAQADGEAARHEEEAEKHAHARVCAAREAGRRAGLEELLRAGEAAHRAWVVAWEWHKETNRRRGFAEEHGAGDFPLPALQALAPELDSLRRDLAGDRRAPVREIPSGQVELRLLEKLHDGLLFFYPGDRAWFDEGVAKDLVTRKLAVEVA
ncbi:MAG: hypothetical protein HY553_08405 [Elusimicrobia bacterium]|nr:hypothetical protein [Elusimicrobiota bacterium]